MVRSVPSMVCADEPVDEDEDSSQTLLLAVSRDVATGPRCWIPFPKNAIYYLPAIALVATSLSWFGFKWQADVSFQGDKAKPALSQFWHGGNCDWLNDDDCVNEDADACKCRELNPHGRCTVCPNSRVQLPVPATVVEKLQPRLGSFLVIGDWGYDYNCHGNVPNATCTRLIADSMLTKMKELGDVMFIINVGDSFYPGGVVSKNDPQWETKWRQIFPKELRNVPWYSVYGNHDLHHDPCACSDNLETCAQVNFNVSNLDYFYMPGYSWFLEIPELELEVVGLELNHFVLGWDQTKPASQHYFEDCRYTSCESTCRKLAKRRADVALRLFTERSEVSVAKNMIVFSHYPTDYFTSVPEFLNRLRDNSRHWILYLGGHRHNVDQKSTVSTSPNDNWLVGGGGGWSCDGNSQGFLVGELRSKSPIKTYPVLVDSKACCGNQTVASRWFGRDCAWLGCDTCTDPKMCDCRALNLEGPCTTCPDSRSRNVVCSGSECSIWQETP